ncbi:hypothetical protein EBB07_00835 [Paenibacillaceae bacterium]|nr:hypothetical protein EBB07_00835 [Paenibacillaceae bacterium]
MRCDPRNLKKWKDELSVVLQRLDAYYKAEEAVLASQEYRIGTRSLKRADLNAIQEEIRRLNDRKDELENSIATCGNPNQRKAYRIIPRDL